MFQTGLVVSVPAVLILCASSRFPLGDRQIGHFPLVRYVCSPDIDTGRGVRMLVPRGWIVHELGPTGPSRQIIEIRPRSPQDGELDISGFEGNSEEAHAWASPRQNRHY